MIALKGFVDADKVLTSVCFPGGPGGLKGY